MSKLTLRQARALSRAPHPTAKATTVERRGRKRGAPRHGEIGLRVSVIGGGARQELSAEAASNPSAAVESGHDATAALSLAPESAPQSTLVSGTASGQAEISIFPSVPALGTTALGPVGGTLVGVAACILSSALAVLAIAAIPTLRAVRAAADEISYLADALRDEVPDTAAAIRLSGLEVSDCAEEIGELSSDLAYGIRATTDTITTVDSGLKKVGRGIGNTVVPLLADGAQRALPVARKAIKNGMDTAVNRTVPLAHAVEDILEERASMDHYTDEAVAIAAISTRQGVSRVRKAIKAAEVAKKVARLYRNVRPSQKRSS